MNADDLEVLDLWSEFPAEHRLAAFLESVLSGPDFKQRSADLASHLGYTRPHIIKLWLNHDAIIPLQLLPKLSQFLGINLSVLVTFWIATYAAPADEADVISKSIAPRITDGEFWIIETARAVFLNQAEDMLEP